MLYIFMTIDGDYALYSKCHQRKYAGNNKLTWLNKEVVSMVTTSRLSKQKKCFEGGL